MRKFDNNSVNRTTMHTNDYTYMRKEKMYAMKWRNKQKVCYMVHHYAANILIQRVANDKWINEEYAVTGDDEVI